MVIVNAYSKLLEVLIVKSITASVTIRVSKMLISTRGIPQKIVSNNSSTFTSDEFKNLCKYVDGIDQARKVFVIFSHYSTLYCWTFSCRTADGSQIEEFDLWLPDLHMSVEDKQ